MIRPMHPRVLFRVRPEEIVEHPTDLPVTNDEIPVGPLRGWLAFAFPLYGKEIVAFKPVIEKPHDDGQPCIRSSEKVLWWFSVKERGNIGTDVACWYQSGATLRFVKEE